MRIDAQISCCHLSFTLGDPRSLDSTSPAYMILLRLALATARFAFPALTDLFDACFLGWNWRMARVELLNGMYVSKDYCCGRTRKQ